VVFVFSLFSLDAAWSGFSLPFAVIMLVFEMMAPAQFTRRSIKNRWLLIRTGDPHRQIAEFSEKVFAPQDSAWVSEDFYYEAKRRSLRTYSGPVVFSNAAGIPYPGESEDLAAISLYIGKVPPGAGQPTAASPPQLSGPWSPTGEELLAWGFNFVVFRRTDARK
jgi:hypothetical protein